MFEIFRGKASKRDFDETGDPLARAIVTDLLITIAGFLMMVVAVLLTVDGPSLN